MGGLADRGADGGDGGVEELELLQVLVPHPVQGHPPPPTPAGSGVTGLHRRLTQGFALLEGRRSAPPRRAWGRGGWVRNDSGRRTPARRVQNTPGSAPDTTPDRPGARRAPKRRFAGNGWWSRLPRWRQKGKPSQAGRQGRTGRRAGAGGAWGLAPWAVRRLKTPIRRPSSPPKETAPFAPRAINCPWERVVLKNSEHSTGAAGRVLSPGVPREAVPAGPPRSLRPGQPGGPPRRARGPPGAARGPPGRAGPAAACRLRRAQPQPRTGGGALAMPLMALALVLGSSAVHQVALKVRGGAGKGSVRPRRGPPPFQPGVERPGLTPRRCRPCSTGSTTGRTTTAATSA